jgi:hypothetical protein
MQQHDHWRVGRPGVDDIEDQVTAAVLVHQVSVPDTEPVCGSFG